MGVLVARCSYAAAAIGRNQPVIGVPSNQRSSQMHSKMALTRLRPTLSYGRPPQKSSACHWQTGLQLVLTTLMQPLYPAHSSKQGLTRASTSDNCTSMKQCILLTRGLNGLMYFKASQLYY